MSDKIFEMSNELELGLFGIEAKDVVGSGLPVTHEINPRDVVELNISMASDLEELNKNVSLNLQKIVSLVHGLGGKIYGGGSVISDTSSLEPKRYRTTSLSETCGRGFLDIMSQQIVLGVNDEKLGFDIYNYFRNNPVLLAISASSPYVLHDGGIKDTGLDSVRIGKYKEICRYFPDSMWKDPPQINSISDYFHKLQSISDEVNRRLSENMMDANWEELTMVRKNGKNEYTFYPFRVLEPHQVYWNVRPRPDHKNSHNGGNSRFSIEFRMPDMPTTPERVKMINSLLIGISYHIAENGTNGLPKCFDGSYRQLEVASKYGLDATIGGNVKLKDLIKSMASIAAYSLNSLGYSNEGREMEHMIENVIKNGNDSTLIRKNGMCSPNQIIEYLSRRLEYGDYN